MNAFLTSNLTRTHCLFSPAIALASSVPSYTFMIELTVHLPFSNPNSVFEIPPVWVISFRSLSITILSIILAVVFIRHIGLKLHGSVIGFPSPLCSNTKFPVFQLPGNVVFFQHVLRRCRNPSESFLIKILRTSFVTLSGSEALPLGNLLSAASSSEAVKSVGSVFCPADDLISIGPQVWLLIGRWHL